MKLLLIAYIAGYIVTFPKRFRYFLDDFGYGWEIETEDVVIASILSILIGVFWPAFMLWDFLNGAIIQPWVKSLNVRNKK